MAQYMQQIGGKCVPISRNFVLPLSRLRHDYKAVNGGVNGKLLEMDYINSCPWGRATGGGGIGQGGIKAGSP